MSEPITIIGYGNQGRAQAQNLRDRGWSVTVALRTGSPRIAVAEADGLAVTTDLVTATRAAQQVALLLPDAAHPPLWHELLVPHLPKGACMVFAHGYNLHYGTLTPRADLDLVLVAPLASGKSLCRNLAEGRPTPIAIAVHQDATGTAPARARAYAEALTNDPRSIFATTVQEETESDLFSEQVLSCGGLAGLIQAAFDTLVAAGVSETMAYYTCLHEVKDLASVFAEEGLAGGFERISPTARYGALTRGPQVIDETVRRTMARLFDEIRSGRFARDLTAEAETAFRNTETLLQKVREHLLTGIHKVRSKE